VAEAVGDAVNWVPGYEEEKETEEAYTIRVVDFKNGGSISL